MRPDPTLSNRLPADQAPWEGTHKGTVPFAFTHLRESHLGLRSISRTRWRLRRRTSVRTITTSPRSRCRPTRYGFAVLRRGLGFALHVVPSRRRSGAWAGGSSRLLRTRRQRPAEVDHAAYPIYGVSGRRVAVARLSCRGPCDDFSHMRRPTLADAPGLLASRWTTTGRVALPRNILQASRGAES